MTKGVADGRRGRTALMGVRAVGVAQPVRRDLLRGKRAVNQNVLPSSDISEEDVAATAPSICAIMKPGVSIGRMPANVSLSDRAIVTAGLANDIDDVNQYAPTI